MQFRDEEDVFVRVEVGGETVTGEGGEVFALEGEVLQCVMAAVAYDDAFLAAGTAVDPNTVWRVESALAAARSAEFTDPVAGFVVAMHAPRAVAVGKQEAAVVEEREVGRHEGIASPTFDAFGVFVLAVHATVHRRVFFPNDLALERELSKGFHVLVSAHIKELFLALGAHLNTVATALKLTAKGADEFALLVENKNGRMILQVLAAFVNDVQQTLRINGDVVRGLPRVFVRQLREAVLHLVPMLAFANDGLLRILVG